MNTTESTPGFAAPIVRIVSDIPGHSHFVDGRETLSSPRGPSPTLLAASMPRSAATTRFIGVAAGWDSALHPAPSTRWAVILRGTVEIRTSLGEARTFGPGATIHLEIRRAPATPRAFSAATTGARSSSSNEVIYSKDRTSIAEATDETQRRASHSRFFKEG
jgi:hypothetical protein